MLSYKKYERALNDDSETRTFFFPSSSFFTSQQFLTLQLKSQEKACAIELEDSSVPIFYIFVACEDNDIVVF